MHRADDAKALDQQRRVRLLATRLRLGLDLWSGYPSLAARAEAFPDGLSAQQRSRRYGAKSHGPPRRRRA